MSDFEPEYECGISEDHDVPEGFTTCRRCDAECSGWDDDDD